MPSIGTWLESHITLHENENPLEERVNAWTHLAGALLSIPGMFLLFRAGLRSGGGPNLWGLLVFGSTMVLLFTASGLYHLVEPSPAKRILRILDHSNIYLLIAGTYTPILMVLENPLRRILMMVIWGIALLGILFTLVFWGRLGFLHVILYLAMGWMALAVWDPFVTALPSGLLFWIIAGGTTYSLGVIFYALKKMPFSHGVWHFFVLAGCGFFYLGIYRAFSTGV